MVQPSSVISRAVAVGGGARLLWHLLLLLACFSCCSSQSYERILLSSIADSMENLTKSVTAQERTSEKLASGLMKLFSFLASDYLPCDVGWFKLGASCYFLGKDISNWQASREKCIAMNSDLAKVTTEEEYNFLRDLVKGHNTWIGLTDLDVEGTYVWNDGTVYSMNKSWWGDGEPNNKGGEHCIHYKASDDDRWNDIPCSKELRYICEKSVFPTED